MTSSSSSTTSLYLPLLGEIQIADSHFLGFCFSVNNMEQVYEYQNKVKNVYPNAAHVPLVWYTFQIEDQTHEADSSWDEDNEPLGSIGNAMLEEIKSFWYNNKSQLTTDKSDTNKSGGIAVIIVRFFKERLLGVTCGRLTQCYRSIVRLTLNRYFFPNQPIDLTLEPTTNIYGMGAGDCELILNVVQDEIINDNNNSQSAKKASSPTTSSSILVRKLLSELQFDGFKGAAGEELPRLQNLQADLSTGFIPVYRYPGNYFGDEWITYDWTTTSLKLKQAVEEKLQPLVKQTMNHCVTNYYRNGTDFIGHHGDKDLDLNRNGVIVSLSLGEERILELRRRSIPQDTIRVKLPHCSMVVLGPNTNRQWTHSILPKEDSKEIRLSLTMREVMTYQDLTTGRLFGQGVGGRTLEEIRRRYLLENTFSFVGFFALSGYLMSRKGITTTKSTILVGAFGLGTVGLRYLITTIERKREVKAARDFFSQTSSSGTKY